MIGERKDRLRRRPETIRYFFLAVSNTTVHTGVSWGGLDYVHKTHGVVGLFLSDLTNGTTTQVKEPVDVFMARWRLNYNNPGWDYQEELKKGISVPVFG